VHPVFLLGAVLKLRYESGFRFGAIEKLLLSIYEPPVCINNEHVIRISKFSAEN